MNGWRSGIGIQWREREDSSIYFHGLYPLILFFFIFIFKNFLLFSHRCWYDSEKKDEVDWGMEDNDL